MRSRNRQQPKRYLKGRTLPSRGTEAHRFKQAKEHALDPKHLYFSKSGPEDIAREGILRQFIQNAL